MTNIKGSNGVAPTLANQARPCREAGPGPTGALTTAPAWTATRAVHPSGGLPNLRNPAPLLSPPLHTHAPGVLPNALPS